MISLPMKRACSLAALLVVAPIAALSQSYPARPIHLVSQFAAGSTGDVLCRVMAGAMNEVTGQPVIVDNRPGAGGVLAAELVARSAPDGYNLVVATTGTQVMRVHLAKNQSFDPVRDFTPITELGETVTLLVAHPSFPPNSLRELLDYARRNPGKVVYGTSGVGSPHHLSGELLQQLTGVQLVHVPYKASAQALQDTIAGQLMTTFAISGLAVPAVRSGKIKALAVNRDSRFSALPDVPTISEAVPGFETPPAWTGLFGPANMPQVLLRQVHAIVVKALNAPPVRAKLAEGYFEVITNKTPEEFQAQIARQIDLVGKIVKASGIQATE
jgi:tripartite-type tricarboxylate transporter receptor subunit TctC